MAAAKEKGGSLVKETLVKWEARLEELRPLVDEFNEINDAVQAVGGRTSTRRRGGGGGGRQRGSGTRAKQFLEVVKATPGISVTDAAKEMGIQPNYLYRVAETLKDEGLIKKSGDGGYEPTAKAKNDDEGNDDE